MTKRETRVINAFINCVRSGEYSLDYAVLLIEDNQRYGWLTEDAKAVFYAAVDPEPERVTDLTGPDVVLNDADGEGGADAGSE